MSNFKKYLNIINEMNQNLELNENQKKEFEELFRIAVKIYMTDTRESYIDVPKLLNNIYVDKKINGRMAENVLSLTDDENIKDFVNGLTKE